MSMPYPNPYATGLDLIRDERLRQQTEEGWTPKHDDEHARGPLAAAAACYALSAAGCYAASLPPPLFWPWAAAWWKPDPRNTDDGQIRDLVRAGALIAAELDRLQRKRRRELEASTPAFTLFEAPAEGWAAMAWAGIRRLVGRRNRAEKAIEQARADNAPWREEETDRARRQAQARPGDFTG